MAGKPWSAAARACTCASDPSASAIVVLVADEPEALTHPYLARAWAKRGAGLRLEAPGQAARIGMIGVLDFVSRERIVETSRSKRNTDAAARLERLGCIDGPKTAIDEEIKAMNSNPNPVRWPTSESLLSMNNWTLPSR